MAKRSSDESGSGRLATNWVFGSPTLILDDSGLLKGFTEIDIWPKCSPIFHNEIKVEKQVIK